MFVLESGTEALRKNIMFCSVCIKYEIDNVCDSERVKHSFLKIRFSRGVCERSLVLCHCSLPVSPAHFLFLLPTSCCSCVFTLTLIHEHKPSHKHTHTGTLTWFVCKYSFFSVSADDDDATYFQ